MNSNNSSSSGSSSSSVPLISVNDQRLMVNINEIKRNCKHSVQQNHLISGCSTCPSTVEPKGREMHSSFFEEIIIFR